MARQRTDMHRLQELVRLHRQGLSARAVARVLRMSPNTERGFRLTLAEAGLLAGDPNDLPELSRLREAVGSAPPRQEVSSVADWSTLIADRLDRGAGPKAIYDWLRVEDATFTGSYAAVKRLCRRLERARGVRAGDVAIPVTTKPGEVAQVDFGYVGQLLDPASGRLRKAWVFVMVLGHSRHAFFKVVFDQKTPTWLRLHVEAFSFFGGVPHVVVPDNLKAAVIRAAFSAADDVELNRSYRELARHYGFRIDPTPPYAPQKKGKVESAVKFVKRSFFQAWSPTTVDEANDGLKRWNSQVAAVRVHGATQKVPLEVFQLEQAFLLALPVAPFEVVVWKEAKVHTDSHVVFERRLYSVPWRLVGQQVWIRSTPGSVVVYANDERVATHARKGLTHRSTNVAHLPEGRVDYRERTREHWEARARRLGEEVGEFVTELFDHDDVLYAIRPVQAVVSLLEKHPRERANAACRRARYFGSYSYPAVRDILRKGLDLQPLPDDELPIKSLVSPTFARDPDEFIH